MKDKYEVCGNCEYYHAGTQNSDKGLCRVNPPNIYMIPDASKISGQVGLKPTVFDPMVESTRPCCRFFNMPESIKDAIEETERNEGQSI